MDILQLGFCLSGSPAFWVYGSHRTGGQIITQLSLVLLENDKLSYLDFGPVPVFEKPDGYQCSVAAGNREIF